MLHNIQDIFIKEADHLQVLLLILFNLVGCHMQVYLSGNNVLAVKPPPNHTSPPSTVATFLVTYLIVVLQPSRYSVFYSGDTPIQLGLL